MHLLVCYQPTGKVQQRTCLPWQRPACTVPWKHNNRLKEGKKIGLWMP